MVAAFLKETLAEVGVSCSSKSRLRLYTGSWIILQRSARCDLGNGSRTQHKFYASTTAQWDAFLKSFQKTTTDYADTVRALGTIQFLETIAAHLQWTGTLQFLVVVIAVEQFTTIPLNFTQPVLRQIQSTGLIPGARVRTSPGTIGFSLGFRDTSSGAMRALHVAS